MNLDKSDSGPFNICKTVKIWNIDQIYERIDQEKKCAILSWGERNRLHLALTLKFEANVLLLDEPTNDIDISTLRSSEEGLENFAECVMVIAHDRWFLDRICTHIFSTRRRFRRCFSTKGSYSEYEKNKRQRWYGVVE